MKIKPLNESINDNSYNIQYFQVFSNPKKPTDNGKMIAQAGTFEEAHQKGKKLAGENNYFIKAVCDDGKVRYIDNDYNSLKLKEGWSHFEFTSGANPYIAKTRDEEDRIKRRYGDAVRYIGNIDGTNYYKVDDSEEERDLFRFDESKHLNETTYGKDELWAYINNYEWAYRTLADAVERGVEKGYKKDVIVNMVAREIYKMKDDFGRLPTTRAERLELARDFVEDELPADYMPDKKEETVTEAFKPKADGIQSVKVYNQYNYTIQELRIDNDKKTFERGNFTMGKPDKKTKNRQEFEDIVDELKKLGYEEIPSDYNSLRNKTRKGVSTKESYWIENKEVMDEVSRLEKQLENDGWNKYTDKYSGSKYYSIFARRGENGGEFKAVKYNHDHTPEIVDLSYRQIIGDEPLDSFDGLRRSLGRALLSKRESMKEDCKAFGAKAKKLTEESEQVSDDEIFKKAVEMLYRMNEFVLDVYDNESWLVYGVPDGEFEEDTVEEAVKNYKDHLWLVEDLETNSFSEDDFRDFIDAFKSATRSSDYDKSERELIVKESEELLA